MLTAVLGSGSLAAGGVANVAFVFTGLVIVSGLAALIALVREGIRSFWASDEAMPTVPLIELVPVVVLLALAAGMTVQAGPVMRYMESTASALNHPHVYIRGVLGPAPEPAPLEPAAPEPGR
jgi:multicomponent K+:H+ antiporter subunit D